MSKHIDDLAAIIKGNLMNSGAKGNLKYDVALSYAGEDRQIAARLTKLLKGRDISAFTINTSKTTCGVKICMSIWPMFTPIKLTSASCLSLQAMPRRLGPVMREKTRKHELFASTENIFYPSV
jgi:hypothetical protein